RIAHQHGRLRCRVPPQCGGTGKYRLFRFTTHNAVDDESFQPRIPGTTSLGRGRVRVRGRESDLSAVTENPFDQGCAFRIVGGELRKLLFEYLDRQTYQPDRLAQADPPGELLRSRTKCLCGELQSLTGVLEPVHEPGGPVLSYQQYAGALFRGKALEPVQSFFHRRDAGGCHTSRSAFQFPQGLRRERDLRCRATHRVSEFYCHAVRGRRRSRLVDPPARLRGHVGCDECVVAAHGSRHAVTLATSSMRYFRAASTSFDRSISPRFASELSTPTAIDSASILNTRRAASRVSEKPNPSVPRVTMSLGTHGRIMSGTARIQSDTASTGPSTSRNTRVTYGTRGLSAGLSRLSWSTSTASRRSSVHDVADQMSAATPHSSDSSCCARNASCMVTPETRIWARGPL